MNFVLRRHSKKLLALAGLLTFDAVIFGSTDAGRVASFMLIVGFLLLMATVYWIAYGLLGFARLYGLPIRRKRRLAGSMTVLAGCLIALQSVGELNPRDVLVLLPLVTIGYIYSFYGAGASRTDSRT